ncbi:unnamed protein product [Protopolystoma xenopodis]|uniref:Uncharacterized protein n=1 Tax=Protopolystoma xenopodis TaxID=117903 RepID=A0A448X8W9_9PLAT|nr:unnamed protein product [Protopolystoma xenopodis]
MLYALRYESNKRELDILNKLAASKGASAETLQVVQNLLNYAGPRRRTDGFDLFSSGRQGLSGDKDASLIATSAMASLTKRLVKGLKGVENVYAQHEPLLTEIINELIKGRLRESSYPSIASCNLTSSQHSSVLQRPPREIIVFIIGGATYEEVLAVHRLNSLTPGVSILLGSTTMLNSRSFIDEFRCQSPEDTSSPSSDLSQQMKSLPISDMPKQSAISGRFGGAVKYHLLR